MASIKASLRERKRRVIAGVEADPKRFHSTLTQTGARRYEREINADREEGYRNRGREDQPAPVPKGQVKFGKIQRVEEHKPQRRVKFTGWDKKRMA